MAYPLVEVREPGKAPWQVIIRDWVEVGRECAGFNLDDAEISRRHLLLSNEQGSLTVTDLGSTNGTTVNGRPVAAATPLRSGDVVGLGGVKIKVL